MGCCNTSIGGSLHQMILDLKLLKLLFLAVEQGFQKYTMIAQGVPIFIRELI